VFAKNSGKTRGSNIGFATVSLNEEWFRKILSCLLRVTWAITCSDGTVFSKIMLNDKGVSQKVRNHKSGMPLMPGPNVVHFQRLRGGYSFILPGLAEDEGLSHGR
jgi:hypothetical protein